MARSWLALSLLLAATVAAHASEPAIAVLGVSGHGGARFAAQLEQDLADSYTVVSRGAYRHAVERSGERRGAVDAVRAVAERLHLTAIVAGAIAGPARHRVLVLTVRSGASGRVTARLRYDLSGHTLPTLRKTAVDALVRAIARVEPAVAASGKPTAAGKATTAPATPTTPTTATAATTTTAATRATTTTTATTTTATTATAGASGDAGESAASAGDPEPAATLVKAEPAAPTLNAVFAAVGLSVTRRSLRFDVAAAPGYRGTPVAGIRAEGALYPIALSADLAEAHPVLASFAIAGAYEQLFSFSSSTPNAHAVGYQSRWLLLLVGYIPLGHCARGGTLAVESGFQRLVWGSQSPAQLHVPDVGYDLVDAGLAWQRALGSRRLVLSLRAAFLGLVGAGAIASVKEYGPAGGWGAEAELGLTVTPTRWLWLRAAGRYTPVLLRFAAAGTRFAHSASDQWLSGVLEVGFAL